MEFLDQLLNALEPEAIRLFAFLGPLTAFAVPAVFEFARQLLRERKRDKGRVDSGAEQQRQAELTRDAELDKEAKRIDEENRNRTDADRRERLKRWLQPERPGDGGRSPPGS